MEVSSIPVGSDYFPFMDEIELTIAMARFQRYFSATVLRLGQSDRQLIELIASSDSESRETFVGIENLPGFPVE